MMGLQCKPMVMMVIVGLLAAASPTWAFMPTTVTMTSRGATRMSAESSPVDQIRVVGSRLLLAATTTAFGGVVVGGEVPTADAAVINVPRCESGRGAGCDALEGDTEFIRKLREKSAQNFDARMQEYVDRYNMNNFKDYFKFRGQVLVKRIGGGFDVVDEAEYRELEKEGKVFDEKWRPGFQPAAPNSRTMGPAATASVPETPAATTTPPPPADAPAPAATEASS